NVQSAGRWCSPTATWPASCPRRISAAPWNGSAATLSTAKDYLYRVRAMTRGPRMTLQTQLVLRAMLAEPAAERYGLQLCAETGLPSGTIYPIVARLEQLGGPARARRRGPPAAAVLPAHRGGRTAGAGCPGPGLPSQEQAPVRPGGYLARRVWDVPVNRPSATARQGSGGADPVIGLLRT